MMETSESEDFGDEGQVYGDRAHLATPLLDESSHGPQHDIAFIHVVSSVEEAIRNGVQPEMIIQGSSGSYFCKDVKGNIVGVFKPKSEEPYGELNPKWGKWFQRNFCCFCFGRSCLPINQGYLSEAGASIVDDTFGLGIVPKTRVVRLVSPNFHYSRFDKTRARAVKAATNKLPKVGKKFRQGLPQKTGSFQLFVRGYEDASVVIRQLKMNELEEATQSKLKQQFQMLVVLDYLIRNTDRGLNNWLIKYTKATVDTPENIDLVAIDHGLAFPLKHPNDWRAYPYHWAWLHLAEFPFTDETVNKILPTLADSDAIETLCDKLFVLFRQDKGFSKSVYDKQMSVFRGQVRGGGWHTAIVISHSHSM
eukprot:m.42608 g.42608  ORF g.42608 m.42608 type:complete len:364 (-) comp7066_c0_seq4:404-1495(-)